MLDYFNSQIEWQMISFSCRGMFEGGDFLTSCSLLRTNRKMGKVQPLRVRRQLFFKKPFLFSVE